MGRKKPITAAIFKRIEPDRRKIVRAVVPRNRALVYRAAVKKAMELDSHWTPTDMNSYFGFLTVRIAEQDWFLYSYRRWSNQTDYELIPVEACVPIISSLIEEQQDGHVNGSSWNGHSHG